MTDILVKEIVRILDENKSFSIVQIDTRGKSAFADTLIIASGRSARQVGALAEILSTQLKKQGLHSKIEGEIGVSEWIIIDCIGIIVHLFSPKARLFYGLDTLWGLPAPVECLES